MPEELVIILAIVIGAIWLLVKIGQGIESVIDSARKDYNEAAARRKETRYAKGRDGLRQYIHVLIPNELDRFEIKFEAMGFEFGQTQKLTNWVARPPSWKKDAI